MLYIGAFAGIISLCWKISDWLYDRRLRPRIKVDVEIVFEEDTPSSVRITATNQGGKTIHLTRAGFLLSNNMIYYHKIEGPSLRWLRSDGGTYEDLFKFEELKDVVKEQKTSIEKAYVQSDNFKPYYGDVPEELNSLFSE